MPWTTIAITVAALALLGGLILALVRVYGRGKVSEVKRDIAQEEAERRREHAEEAAKPMSRTPLTGPGGLFDK
jgi:hypothetical protein